MMYSEVPSDFINPLNIPPQKRNEQCLLFSGLVYMGNQRHSKKNKQKTVGTLITIKSEQRKVQL